jgi:hypothetical protein
MFVTEKAERWGRFGLKLAIGATIANVLLSLMHAAFELASYRTVSHEAMVVLITLCNDLRYLTEQLLYVGALVFVGGKFFETRTIFTVGFDKLDAAKVAMKGPDDDNVVWIGHRYATPLEAQTVAAAIEERLKASA